MINSFAIFDGMGSQEVVIVLAILIVMTFHLAMLFDLLVRKKAGSVCKVIWFLVIFLVPVVGPTVYFVYGNSKQLQKRSTQNES